MQHYHYLFWETWDNQQKVTFDGPNKLILVNPGVTTINVKEDIYSDWKEWVQYYSNASFLRAIRVIGGDPVGGGLFAGDIYFLQNGWRIVIAERVNVDGVIYHDDSIDPYVILKGGGVVSSVSNLVQTASTGGGGAVDYAAIANAVRQEIDQNSTSLAEITNIVNSILTKANTSGVDVDTLLTDLINIDKKIGDTQAFILSQ
jgi:hypothetical protein